MKIDEQKHYFKIIRQTSKYNKYIKWFARIYKDPNCTQLIFSSGYKTQKEARASCSQKALMPIGNRLIKIEYIEVI